MKVSDWTDEDKKRFWELLTGNEMVWHCDNFITYLLQNTESWGWVECKNKECTHIQCPFEIINSTLSWLVYDNKGCKVKHPALLFAEEKK